jgi:hypothetical protein
MPTAGAEEFGASVSECVCVFVSFSLKGDACYHSVHSFFLSYHLLVINIEIKIHKTVIWLFFKWLWNLGLLQ